MISDSIIVAIITGCVTCSGSLLGFVSAEKARQQKISEEHGKKLSEMEGRLSSQIATDKAEYVSSIHEVKKEIADMKKMRSDLKSDFEKTALETKLQIANLTEKVEKHNSVVERTFALESDVKVIKEKVSVANHRIDDLENND